MTRLLKPVSWQHFGNRKSVSQNKMCKIKLKLNSLMKSDDLQRIIQAAVSVGGQPF